MAAQSDGHLLVTNSAGHRIHRISPDGEIVDEWGGEGSAPGQFRSPQGMAVDANGDVYVADSGNHRIQKLGPDGSPLAQWGTEGSGAGQLKGPNGLAVDREGNLFVAEPGVVGGPTHGNNRVQKLAPDGRPLAHWGALGDRGPHFAPYGPMAVAVDHRGSLYIVCDGIVKFGVDGDRQRWPIRGSEGIAVDRHGHVYVTDSTYHRVLKLSPSGQLLAEWGIWGIEPGQFSNPRSIAIDTQGNLYVADTGNHRIQKLGVDRSAAR